MKNKLDTYLNLCTQFYDLSKPSPPKEDYDFYLSYAKEADGPILEPMCGTGRFLLPMLADGFDVEGFDASQPMLDALHAKATAQGLKPVAWNSFLQELARPKQYSLIFIPSGSFGLITDLNEVKSALRTIYDHLRKDGTFVFETETLSAVPTLAVWRGSRLHRPDGKTILLSQLAMIEDAICYSIGKYELIDTNHIIQTEVEEYKIRLYNDTSLLLGLLEQIGFKSVKLVKAFDRRALPGEKDETILYECKK